ncbi:hypothetical protein WL56_31580 [Burkholderia cepacia]|nr:hypothetical protein WL56_31580 [Burkholderia cepacia]
MKLSVTIWTQCDRIFDRILTVIGKTLLVMYLKVRCAVLFPKKRSWLFATLTSAIRSKQDLCNNVSASNVDLRNSLDLDRLLVGS